MERMKWMRAQWDRVAAVATLIAGAVSVVAGWYRLSGTAKPAQQLSYLASGGLFGLFLLGVAGVLWLSADLRDEWHKLDRIEQKLGTRSSGAPHHEPRPAEPAPEPDGEVTYLSRAAVSGP